MDWEHHFRRLPKTIPRNSVQFGSEQPAEFGEFLGEHTVDDLLHMMEAYDGAFNQIENKIQDLPPTDPKTAEWMSEFMTLRERYLIARSAAQKVVDEWSVLPNSVRTAEPEYQGILRALQKEVDAYQRGDYQDLYNRLSELLAYRPNIYMPQPKQDFDTAFLHATSGVASTIDTALHPLDSLSNAFKRKPIHVILAAAGGVLLLKFLLTPAKLFPGIPFR